MDPRIVLCEDDRCILIADDSLKAASRDTVPGQFNRVIADIAKAYPKAILVGAAAAAQYIRHSNEPRITRDVDVILEEKEFADFLMDSIPEDTLTTLETYFDDSDSINHSLKHRETGIYVDLLSVESKPIRRKVLRYILANRRKTTNTFQVGKHSIDILKPELLIAMKLNRYAKSPRSDRALCDRVDILKVLRALWDGEISVDHEAIDEFCNSKEAECYASMLDDVECDMRD